MGRPERNHLQEGKRRCCRLVGRGEGGEEEAGGGKQVQQHAIRPHCFGRHSGRHGGRSRGEVIGAVYTQQQIPSSCHIIRLQKKNCETNSSVSKTIKSNV